MFAQANSEHCRHKIFNATWNIDGVRASRVAVPDDPQHDERSAERRALRLQGQRGGHRGARRRPLFRRPATNVYARARRSDRHPCKVETHNHPTAISPYPGAATGSGGEIRDEGATGRGGKPKAGLGGFTVSNSPPRRRPAMGDATRPPGAHRLRARHHDRGPARRRPPSTTSSAARTSAATSAPLSRRGRRARALRGYHKPIMLAGGMGNIRAGHIEKGAIFPATRSSCSAARPCSSGSAAARPPLRRRPGDEELDFARSSATTPRCSAAPGGHRSLLGARR